MAPSAQPSLRRHLFLGGAILGGVAAAAMLTFISLSASIRRTLDASTEQLIVEQQIADQIVSSSYSQQLIAYRYLETPDPSILAAFHERGQQAYMGIRQYLFRQMPVSARLKVEAIKTAHQQFEVTAERAFDLSRIGEAKAAHARIAGLSVQAAVLEDAVRSFIAERAEQRRVLTDREETSLRRLEAISIIVAIALAVLAILFAQFVRRRVLVPLQRLTDAVGRLGTDAEPLPMGRQRYSELELLASKFDSMADRIRSSQREIEARNRDLTHTLDDLRRAQQELVQHEKLSAMGEMLAGLAHELNNPLAGILGIAESLESELGKPTRPESHGLVATMIQPLVRESLRARDLVRSLLHFARQTSPHLEAVGLADAVDVAVGLRRHVFTQARKVLSIHVGRDLYVVGQSQKLQHAIINIMNNALDAMVGGRGTRLRIAGHLDGDVVVLTFEDDGPGFREPERVFDPFYTTKPVGRGTGLGLSLVHRFVQEFGGTITAENAPTGGARLVMRLPAARPPVSIPSPAPPAPVVTAPIVATHPAIIAGASDRPRVLVVDDEPALRTIQVRFLEPLGVDVETVDCGADARAALEAGDFDVVITDLRMPGEVTGRELLAWLARHRPLLAERVLVVTGELGDPGLLSPLKPEQILTKPFGRAEYVERVQNALAQASRGKTQGHAA